MTSTTKLPEIAKTAIADDRADNQAYNRADNRADNQTATTNKGRSLLASSAAVVLALGLVACQPKPEVVSNEVRSAEPTVGQQVDNAMANAERKSEQVGADISAATTQAGNAIADASITAAVTAKIAADSDLSTFRINVDTEAGRVALSGDAPNAAARDRANELARSVDGVVDVNNQLTIKAKE